MIEIHHRATYLERYKLDLRPLDGEPVPQRHGPQQVPLGTQDPLQLLCRAAVRHKVPPQHVVGVGLARGRQQRLAVGQQKRAELWERVGEAPELLHEHGEQAVEVGAAQGESALVELQQVRRHWQVGGQHLAGLAGKVFANIAQFENVPGVYLVLLLLLLLVLLLLVVLPMLLLLPMLLARLC